MTGYVGKGPDRAEVAITTDENEINHDEPKQYLDTRYVSSCECLWRFFEYKMQHSSHSVIRLPVHLKDQHKFYFNENDDQDDIREKMKNKKTELMAYFELNKTDVNARNYLYQEIPENYVFNSRAGVWTERKKHSCIGRITSVSPTDKDCLIKDLIKDED